MSRPKRKKEKKIYQPPTPPGWKGRDSVDLAFQLNQRAFALMRDMAVRPNENDWPFVAQDRELWARLDAGTIERAARFPFLILDVHFTDIAWWHSDSKPPEVSQWPVDVSEQLMSETLVFAWHTAKWDRRVARLSVGMLPGVAESIAALTPRQLAALSKQHSSGLSLRWHDNAEFWMNLLVAATSGDDDDLEDIHLHAKLLLSGELIARSALLKIRA